MSRGRGRPPAPGSRQPAPGRPMPGFRRCRRGRIKGGAAGEAESAALPPPGRPHAARHDDVLQQVLGAQGLLARLGPAGGAPRRPRRKCRGWERGCRGGARLGKDGGRDGSRAVRPPRCSRGSALRGQAAALGFNQRCFGSGFKPRQKFCWSREPPRSAARRRGPAQVWVMLGFDSPAVLPLALCCTRSTHRGKARVSLLPRCLNTSIVATRVSVFLLLAPPSRAGATGAWVIPSMGHASVCLQVKGFEQLCFIDNNREC